jgi:hypothetical protein
MIAVAESTFAPEEFGWLVETAIRAGQDREPLLAKTDSAAVHGPYITAAAALRDHFGDDKRRFESAMARFVALMHLFTHNRLGKWVRTSPRNATVQDIHPAVIHAAAQMKLNKNGKFPERKFLSLVAELASEQYRGLADWGPITQ